LTRRYYFDYCATTPIHPEVLEAMQPALIGSYGNPSSLHLDGQQARALVENARTQVADGIGADPDEIVFTSGATEANNLALIGVTKAIDHKRSHLVTSAIEHHAVLHTADALVREGHRVSYLPVDQSGRIKFDELVAAFAEGAGLASIMYVNNEVGSVQPIKKIGELARRKGIILHTDAVQAVGYFNINVDELGVDLLSLSAHKIYGPKGIGALYIRKGTPVDPILFGGAQEGKRRPGTENVPGIVGLGAAMELRTHEYQQRYKTINKLRQLLIKELCDSVPGLIINGPKIDAAPHIVSVSFPGVDGELMLYHLNQAGVSVSMGSACTAESIEPSHVLTAMKIPISLIEGTLRISLGVQTTEDEIHSLIPFISKVVKKSKV
jgi:cysteine desulfurase